MNEINSKGCQVSSLGKTERDGSFWYALSRNFLFCITVYTRFLFLFSFLLYFCTRPSSYFLHSFIQAYSIYQFIFVNGSWTAEEWSKKHIKTENHFTTCAQCNLLLRKSFKQINKVSAPKSNKWSSTMQSAFPLSISIELRYKVEEIKKCIPYRIDIDQLDQR